MAFYLKPPKGSESDPAQNEEASREPQLTKLSPFKFKFHSERKKTCGSYHKTN